MSHVGGKTPISDHPLTLYFQTKNEESFVKQSLLMSSWIYTTMEGVAFTLTSLRYQILTYPILILIC